MATPSELRAWRRALWKAWLAGLREVRDGNGETIAYKTDREMASAIAAAPPPHS